MHDTLHVSDVGSAEKSKAAMGTCFSQPCHACTVDTSSQLQPMASIVLFLVTAWECLTVAMKIALELSDVTA